MEWFSIYEFRPKHGSHIWVWDLDKQKLMFLYAFWEEERFSNIELWPKGMAPMWAYVYKNIDPMPKLSKE